VEIPLPQQILANRRRVVESFGLPWYKQVAFGVWSRPAMFDAATRAGAALTAPLRRRDGLLRLPLPPAWAWRTAPALAPRPARDLSLGRTFEPFSHGPWTTSGARGLTVAYFLQCVADRFAPEQVDAALAVLRACGARVVVPNGQHCCGLPGIDAGHQPTAVDLARQTIQTLESVAADYIVTGAASCAIAMLHDYPRVLRDEPEWVSRAEQLAARTLDLLSFLDRVADPPGLPPRAEGPVVTYHSFCQSTNVLGILPLGPRLLERAGVRLQPLAEMDVCCGFGGGASIDHPEVSRGIALRKLDNVRETRASVLCTDNPGARAPRRLNQTVLVRRATSVKSAINSGRSSSRSVAARGMPVCSSQPMVR
jgi:L-lactate dehydrogenase complex protein LldE